MRSFALYLVLTLTACAADDGGDVDARGSGPDAATSDAIALDGSLGNGVLCARANQTCSGATPECCDVESGTDTCIAQSGACAGDRLECDGPEDCGQGQECCLFEGQGSRCLDEGICGTTGSISNEMCHVREDCDLNETCCASAPAPDVDLYPTCLVGACPQ